MKRDEKQAFTYGSIIVCTPQLPYEDFRDVSESGRVAVCEGKAKRFLGLIEKIICSQFQPTLMQFLQIVLRPDRNLSDWR